MEIDDKTLTLEEMRKMAKTSRSPRCGPKNFRLPLKKAKTAIEQARIKFERAGCPLAFGIMKKSKCPDFLCNEGEIIDGYWVFCQLPADHDCLHAHRMKEENHVIDYYWPNRKN